MSPRQLPAAIAHRFTVQGYVGAGLCGAVYLARDRNGTSVALKLFRQPRGGAVFSYFANELLLLRALAAEGRHPHIAEFVAGSLEQPAFLATRFVEGGRELHVLTGQPLAPERVARIVAQTADALDYLHAGHPVYSPIVHRDVKPSNILLDRNDDVVLIDLSIARHALHRLPDEPGLGSIPYMAPEQHRGAATPATDQFALALVALELLTGRRLLPTTAAGALEVLGELAATGGARIGMQLARQPQTARVLQRALAIAPGERFATCGAFAAALRRALAEDQAASPNHAAEWPARRNLGRRLWLAAGAATLLLATAAGATGLAQPAPRLAATWAPPAPQAAAPHDVMAVTRGEVLRSAPSTAALVLERLEPGAQVRYTGRSVERAGLIWHEIEHAGRSGWCRATHCELTAGAR